MTEYILALDQGTTSTRAIIFDKSGRTIVKCSEELKQYYPISGWVEHNPEEIYAGAVSVIKRAIEKSGIPIKDIAALGITNQRETAVVWDKTTGNRFTTLSYGNAGAHPRLWKSLKTAIRKPLFIPRPDLCATLIFPRLKLNGY